MRNSRALNKVIEFYQTKNVSDGVGGYKVFNEYITESWAEVKTFNNGSRSADLSQFGINDTSSAILITTRKREDINYNSVNQFIRYGGVNYVVTTYPTDVDFKHSFIQFIAVRQVTKKVSIIAPINPDTNKVYIDYLERVEDDYPVRGLITSAECTRAFIDGLWG
jgi:hypothetical protein